MKTARVSGPGHINLVEVGKPAMKSGHVLVSMKVIALCGSDVQYVYYSRPQDYPLPLGASGHEFVGVVEESDCDAFQPGDVALVLIPDLTGLAEYRLAEPRYTIKMPPDRNPDHLVMAQPLGTVLWACRRLDNIIGQDAVVLGQGGLGLLFDWVLRRLGARQVIGIDLEPARLDMALQMGATHGINASFEDPLETVRELTGGAMADLVVEAAGEVETINLCHKLAKIEGQLVLFGIPRGPDVLPFQYYDFFRRYLRVFSSSEAEREPGLRSFHLALDYVIGGEIDISPMITHRFPFTEAGVQHAFHLAHTREEGACRVLIG